MRRGILAAIIADDLTGAMDSAAPFANRGLDVKVLTTPSEICAIGADLPQVLSITTNTRHVSAGNAVRIVQKVVDDLLTFNPELVIKKIDSTLRGNVVAEILAAMQVSGRNEVIVCPAVPAQGRTFVGGQIYIDSVELQETAIARDSRSSPARAPLQDLFHEADPSLTISLTGCRGLLQKSTLPARDTLYLPDAKTGDELKDLARLAQNRPGDILFAGASGITEALAEILYGPATAAAAPKLPEGKALFVVGSLAPQAAAQVKRLCQDYNEVRVFVLSESRADNLSGLKALADSGETIGNLVIRPPYPSEKTGLDADTIAKNLADCCAAYLEQAAVALLLATGGDTAAALLARLDLRAITIGGEVLPGIVHGLVNTPHGPLRLVTKAGGFGDDRLFCSILEYFR